MGVPGLFSSLIRNFKHASIITKNVSIDTNIDSNSDSDIHSHSENVTNTTNTEINTLSNHIYLDFNCAIYTALYATPGIKTEETLILYVLEYLETLCKIVSNVELIYIALDGVPSRAKIENQRQRRFHSICKKNRINKINQTFGSETDKTNVNNDFDTNCISPGTIFMDSLSQSIKKRISINTTKKSYSKGSSTDNANIFANKKVIFSDSSISGEGENKIMLHIKHAEHLAINGNEKERILYGNKHNTLIYGLDGDLIFLSLLLQKPNTYLFREANEYGNLASIHDGKKFLFLNINSLSLAIFDDFKKYSPSIDIANKNRYIDDYIVLCMLLGNDFMPKNHWYSIHEGGMDKFLSCYFQIHNHSENYLYNTTSLQINTEMLADIWFLIKNKEQDAVRKLFDKRKKLKIHITDEMTERERQQMITDFYPLQHLYIEQEIAPHIPNWQQRYYKICFNMDNTPDNISTICQLYIKTLVWNTLYYFDECPSWTHYYPYAYAPIFSDVYDELIKHKNINPNSNKLFQFGKTTPIEQQTLLFTILPIASKRFMPIDAVRKLTDIKCPMNIYFPKKYGLNVAFHRYYHECTPILYKMDLDIVKKFMKDCKLNEDELRRNLIGDLFIRN